MNTGIPQVSQQNGMLRIGIIGAGQMARQHARAIGRLQNAKVTAVVDPDPVALEEIRRIAPGANPFASLADLVRSNSVDVVHICTPPQTHEILTEQSLDAGLHVYVEKPFVDTHASALRLAKLADRHGLKICAGHQLLYEPPTRRAVELLPVLGDVAHIESYFSFRAATHTPTGRAPLRADLQLLDILPHPVYVLLDFLERASEGKSQLASVEIGPRGTVHALIRRGSLTGTLVVTLDGRPVESYLKIVGSNGSVYCDYVRSTVQTNVGPGASGVDKLLSPYRAAWQLLTGTTASMSKRFLKRQQSYPGLAEIFTAFYESISQNAPSPVTRANLLGTVAICEQIAHALDRAYSTSSEAAPAKQILPVVVTGGTGILGKEVARALLAAGEQVRVVARRTPPEWEKIPGVSYVVADVSQPIGPEVMAGAQAVIHCAAETAGRWEQHQKNSVNATEQVVRAAASAGVKRFVHVSSISVLAVPARGERLTDYGAIEPNSRSGGPNAWGKIESERIAVALCKDLGIELRIARPSAIVDYRSFDPPGLLGRRLGNTFVAVGLPNHQLGVVDVVFAGQTLAWIARHFDEAPTVMNLFEPDLPTKRQLLTRLKRSNPDLTIVWLLPPVLVPLSWFALGLQKLLRPGRPAMNLATMFARLRYDTTQISALAPVILADSSQAKVGDAQDGVPAPTEQGAGMATFGSTMRQMA
jgi:predicted dehydrogenase/nucleoside-diphosphate-sugar epimerase